MHGEYTNKVFCRTATDPWLGREPVRHHESTNSSHQSLQTRLLCPGPCCSAVERRPSPFPTPPAPTTSTTGNKIYAGKCWSLATPRGETARGYDRSCPTYIIGLTNIVHAVALQAQQALHCRSITSTGPPRRSTNPCLRCYSFHAWFGLRRYQHEKIYIYMTE